MSSVTLLNASNPSPDSGLTLVVDLTQSRNSCCSFCGVANHRITNCNDLLLFENSLLEKWRKNLSTPDLFIDWVRENFQNKLVPYTRRIYTLNHQKNSRVDEFSCLSAICNRMNTLHLSSFITGSIERQELLEQERLLAEIEAEQLAEATAESFAAAAEENNVVNKKRKVLLIYDNEHNSAKCSEANSCNICMEDFPTKLMVRVNCGHLFCSPCAVRLRQDFSHCANCRSPITETVVFSYKSLSMLKKN